MLFGITWNGLRIETNRQDTYLRNRVRRKLHDMPSVARRELLRLYEAQQQLAGPMKQESERLLGQTANSRYFYSMIDEGVAVELLRRVTHSRLTRPRLQRLYLLLKRQRQVVYCRRAAAALFIYRQRFYCRFDLLTAILKR